MEAHLGAAVPVAVAVAVVAGAAALAAVARGAVPGVTKLGKGRRGGRGTGEKGGGLLL